VDELTVLSTRAGLVGEVQVFLQTARIRAKRLTSVRIDREESLRKMADSARSCERERSGLRRLCRPVPFTRWVE
jgi:hypothetical protein